MARGLPNRAEEAPGAGHGQAALLGLRRHGCCLARVGGRGARGGLGVLRRCASEQFSRCCYAGRFQRGSGATMKVCFCLGPFVVLLV